VKTFGKDEIIRGRKNFRIVYERGIELRGKILRCLVVRADSHEIFSNKKVLFGISVSRKVRLAVKRNHIKRLIRESYRKNRDLMIARGVEITYPIAFLFIFSPMRGKVCVAPQFNEIDNDMKNILNQILHDTFNC